MSGTQSNKQYGAANDVVRNLIKSFECVSNLRSDENNLLLASIFSYHDYATIILRSTGLYLGVHRAGQQHWTGGFIP